MARQIIRDFKPDAVIGVGGYASANTSAASSLGIPTLIQEQNSYATLPTNCWLKKLRIFVWLMKVWNVS